jgi:TPR repeat protein
MMLVQLIYWQLIISREEMVCCKMKKAAKLGSSDAHYHLGDIYSQGGDLKKTKFLAGHEVARYNLACVEYNSGNIERALNHWIIAASAGGYHAMHALRISFEQGHVSRDSMDSTLIAYYNSCAEMRSEARDAMIHKVGLSMVLIFPLQVEI